MKRIVVNKSLFKYILFFLSATLMILFFSLSTSPLYHSYKAWDSSFFQVMGKEMLKGLIPYKDMWDQKGPAIFFVNMLGFLIAGNKYGIFLIQILFATVAELFFYKILRRSLSENMAVLCACVGIFVFSCNYEGGNLVEEYISPFLIICFYLITEWGSQKDIKNPKHKPIYAFFYGITFGLCLMSRVTNAIGICIAVCFIFVYLCMHKVWENIIKNIISFVVGTAIAIVPFMIYFSVKNCTYDFWYGTILFNISYAAEANNSMLQIIKAVPRQIGSYAIICTGFLYIYKKKYFNGAMYIMIGVGTQLLLMNIFSYPHYSMITFPYLPVSVYEIKKIMSEARNNVEKKDITKYAGTRILIFTLLIALLTTGRAVFQIARYHIIPQIYNKERVSYYEQLLEVAAIVPTNEKEYLVGYNTNPTLYLDLDISPKCRFFAYQDWQASFSDSFAELLNEEFDNKKPLWLIFLSDKKSAIDNVLNSYYEIVRNEPVIGSDSGEKIILYRLIQ